MKQRGRISKLRDLLPEILIEAQGCDEVTAEAALRRTVEHLCIMYGFSTREMNLLIGNDDETEGCDVLPVALFRSTDLRVTDVSVRRDGRMVSMRDYEYDGAKGILWLSRNELPSELEHNGHKTHVAVTLEVMPYVDADVSDFENFTKWRTLIVALTLKDLFSMTKMPWANDVRYTAYSVQADKLTERYLAVERHFRRTDRPRYASGHHSENIFC